MGRRLVTIPRRTSCTSTRADRRASLGLVKPDPAKNDMNYVQGSALTGARAAVPMGAAPGRAVGRPSRPARQRAPASAGGAGGWTRGGAGGGGGEGGGGGLTVQGLPIVKPPYGSISAISLDKGEILWQIAHGDTPDNVRNHPALKGLNIPRTGQAGIIGTLVTKTLLIAGEAQVTTGGPSARRAAARLRQGDRQGRRLGADAGAAERLADDVHAERQAVHRRRHRRWELSGRAARVPAAKLTSGHLRVTRTCSWMG